MKFAAKPKANLLDMIGRQQHVQNQRRVRDAVKPKDKSSVTTGRRLHMMLQRPANVVARRVEKSCKRIQ